MLQDNRNNFTLKLSKPR